MRPHCRKTTVYCALFTFLATVNIVCHGQTSDAPLSDASVSSVSVKLTPVSSTIGVGANRHLNATVSGSTNHGVTWTVNGIANGNATYGTVDPTTQLYFAPASVPNLSSFKIVATSKADKTKSATATVSVVPADPLGTVNNVKTITCPGGGLSGATCQQMAIACEGVSNWNAYVKINRPSGTSKGVVMYGIGTGGSGLYDTEFTYGQTAVQNVLDAGFTTVQVSFGAPFTGRGSATGVPLRHPGTVGGHSCSDQFDTTVVRHGKQRRLVCRCVRAFQLRPGQDFLHGGNYQRAAHVAPGLWLPLPTRKRLYDLWSG
jgi:hypothetical protein